MAGRNYKNDNGDYSTEKAVVRNEAGFDQEVSLVALEDQLINKVKAGDVCFMSSRWTNVANNASIYYWLDDAKGRTLHFLSEMNSVGLWQFDSYIGATINEGDEGTQILPVNRNSGKPISIESKFYRDPTVTDEGTPRLSFDFGGGTSPARASTVQFNQQLESIFNSEDKALIKLTNLSGSTQRITVVANVYEENE